jgi:3-methylcrotonyl-CoA carboxylase alpha subunit
MLTTHYIERSFPGGWQAQGDSLQALALGALGCALAAQSPAEASPWLALGAWRVLGPAAPVPMPVLLEDASRSLHTASVRRDGALWAVEIGDRCFAFTARLDDGQLEIEHDGARELHRFLRTREGSADWVWLHGPRGTHAWTRIDRTAYALAGAAAGSAAAGNSLRAPMPGLVTAVSASVGARVQAGDALLILEAMKMMHALSAPVAGMVAELRCRVGDSVRGGDVLVTIEPEATI